MAYVLARRRIIDKKKEISMNSKVVPLFILFFFGVLTIIQAEEPDITSEINRLNEYVFSGSVMNAAAIGGSAGGEDSLHASGGDTVPVDNAITDEQARSLISQFLMNTFNRHVRARELKISEISLTVDWNTSTASLVYLNIGARFTNFPINTRILNGRLETQLAMRPPEQRWIFPDRDWRIENGDNRDLNIRLFVDDQLTNENRRAMTTDYIRRNYNNPIDIQIYDERTEIYGDRVYSYVSSVVNNDSIVYLRVIFEKQPAQIETSSIFTIEGGQWLTNRAEVIFSKAFPNNINDESIREINDRMFGHISDFHARTNGSKNYLRGTSKVRSIGSVELKSAGDGIIKLELNTIYRLDFSGWFGSYFDYSVLINVYFQFDIENGRWIFRSMEDIVDGNIRRI
jgi:hypothetical protein